jgi:hypothetical protein
MMKPRSKGRKHWLSEEGEFRIEKGVFLLRLESVPTVCFVGVTAISNRIPLRLEIGFEGWVKPGGMRPAAGTKSRFAGAQKCQPTINP